MSPPPGAEPRTGLTRRQVLALLAIPPAAAMVGAGAVGLSWWKQPAGTDYRFLAPEEAAFLRSLAGAGWPATTHSALDGEQADLDRFVDANLITFAPLQRDGMRAGFHALNTLPVATHGSRFTSLDRAARTEVLEGWLHSDLMPLRQAITGLVVLLGMGYTVHPDTRDVFGHLYGCGYHA